VIPSRFEPSTFRLVAQCLNQLRHCVKNVRTTLFTREFIIAALKNVVEWEEKCVQTICGKNLKERGQFEYLVIDGVALKRILVDEWTLNGIVIEQRPMMVPC
jgi:hypothetical protein